MTTLCAHCLCYSPTGLYEQEGDAQVWVCDECHPEWSADEERVRRALSEEKRARAAWETISASVEDQDQQDDW